jgi:hypothetical protein
MIYRKIVNGIAEESDAANFTFEDHYNVIVVGLGTAGSYALVAAAKEGVKALGIEKYPGVGGMGTYGYVSGYYYGVGGGLHMDIDNEAVQLRDDILLSDVEAKKYLLEKLSIKEKGKLMFESIPTGVFMEGKQLKGVSVFSQGRICNYSCDILIDATAEADICYIAGCNMSLGRKSDGKTRPFTSVKVFLNKATSISRTNHDSGYVNQYNPFELTKGIMDAHLSQLLDEFQDNVEKVLFLAPHIGIREGRLIESERNITMEDILADKLEKDVLFYAYSDFDKHGKDNVMETETLQDWYIACNLSTACLSVPIGIKAMIPKGYKSIIAAGRHIGLDHDAASLVRMKRDMHKCGEAAGVCAAIASKKGVQPFDIPYEEVKPILEATGCLQEAHNVGIWFDDSFRREKINWLTNSEEIKAQLSTDMPGIALYSCKLLGEKISNKLKEWLSSGDEALKYNSAIALGLIEDTFAAPYLREIVKNRDAFYFKDCRRTNQLRSVIAIYLLGKLGDDKSLALFEEILCDKKEYERGLYHEIKEPSYKFNTSKSFNEVYYQIVVNAAMAVVKLMKKDPSLKESCSKILREAFKDDYHVKNVTTLPENTYEYGVFTNVADYAISNI